MGKTHMKALKSLDFSIESIVDINPQCFATSDINECNISCYSHYSEITDKSHLDIVCIATTANQHIELALEAINGGAKFILIEKPLGTSLKSCQRLAHIAKEKKVKIAVNHQMRYLPQYSLAKELVNSHEYGGLQSMQVAAGNFGLAMNGTHYFEAFRFLTDEAPAEVSAWFNSCYLPNPRGPQFQDASGCIRVTTTSGKRLYIDASANHGHGVQVTYMSRNGRITVDELTGTMTTVVRQPEHREAPTSRYGMPVDIEEHKIQPVELVESTKAVLEALLKGEAYPTLQDATLAVKTLVAAYHSHRKGGIPVKIADIPDNEPEVFPWA